MSLQAWVSRSLKPLPEAFPTAYAQMDLEVDASYTDWSSFGTVTIHQSPPPFPVKQNIPVALDWQPSWMYEFGVTRYFDNGWHVSAGYVYDENSVPNAYYTPLAADLNRNFFSIGAGYQGKTSIVTSPTSLATPRRTR